MELSPTAYVILGFLRTSPRSGYEIKALVDNSTRFFWAASYGQIYPELRRLAAAGLIEGSDASRDGRKRTVYAITTAGRKELRAWLRKPPETYEMRDEGLLKLFFADALPPQEAAGTLRAMRERGGLELLGLETARPEAVAAAAAQIGDVDAERVRALGSVAVTLCLVAGGQLDAMLSLRQIRSVDAAAGQLIVREAGGVVSFPEAERLDLEMRSRVLAARDPQLLARVRNAFPGH